jgi:hypothetical protein
MFDQRPFPDGVLAIVVDDGTDIRHLFTESEPWCVVREAMSRCADEYATTRWVRVSERAPSCTCASR